MANEAATRSRGDTDLAEHDSKALHLAPSTLNTVMLGRALEKDDEQEPAIRPRCAIFRATWTKQPDHDPSWRELPEELPGGPTNGAPNLPECLRPLAHDELHVNPQHAISSAPELRVTASISALALRVVASVNFNDQPRRRSDRTQDDLEVFDVGQARRAWWRSLACD